MAVDSINAINALYLDQSSGALQKASQGTEQKAQTSAGAAKVGADFSQFLKDALQEVDNLQKQAEVASIGLATGQIQDLHTAVIAMEKASLSLSLTVEIRNRVLDAYQEIMRMQI